LAQVLITEFHFYFKLPSIKTKSRKKISIDGLSEFQWSEIEAKVEIGKRVFGSEKIENLDSFRRLLCFLLPTLQENGANVVMASRF